MSSPGELLQAIRQRPGLYFGDGPLLTSLHAFLLGHQIGSGNDPSSPFALPSDFTGWVAYRTGASRSLHLIAMFHSVLPDEKQAFTRFFELLEEHRSRKGRLIAQVTGHGKFQRLLNPIDLTSLREDPLPDPILLTTYTDDPGFLATDPDGFPFGLGCWRSWKEFAGCSGFTEEHLVILDREEFERVRD